jgi:hypothetical protein
MLIAETPMKNPIDRMPLGEIPQDQTGIRKKYQPDSVDATATAIAGQRPEK